MGKLKIYTEVTVYSLIAHTKYVGWTFRTKKAWQEYECFFRELFSELFQNSGQYFLWIGIMPLHRVLNDLKLDWGVRPVYSARVYTGTFQNYSNTGQN